MIFFKAQVNGEPVYFKTVTWYAARDLGRRLWPFDEMEEAWEVMRSVEGLPPRGKGIQVYEQDPELKDPRFVAGYEFDTVAKAKPKAKAKAVSKMKVAKPKKRAR